MIAVKIAAIGRITAMKGPIIAYDTVTESTPVSGVDIRKDVVAALDAPLRRKPRAAGITPHEQSGSGAPNRAAFTVDMMPGFPKCLART